MFHEPLKDGPPSDTETSDSVLRFGHGIDNVTSLTEEHFLTNGRRFRITLLEVPKFV